MEFKNSSFILASEFSKSFTFLNRYDKKKHRFEGEYSLYYNSHTRDSFFLSKFLFENQGKSLMLLPSSDSEYSHITNSYKRYLEGDIDKYIEEKNQKTDEVKKSTEFDKSLGQLQLSIVKQMVEKQLESIRKQPAESAADHQVLLGKELSLQWVSHMIQDVVEKGNIK